MGGDEYEEDDEDDDGELVGEWEAIGKKRGFGGFPACMSFPSFKWQIVV